MKRLTLKKFYSAIELCNFINENYIQKEDIQIITQFGDLYTLFYWRGW